MAEELTIFEPGDKRASITPRDQWIRVGTLEEVRARGLTDVHGGACSLLVAYRLPLVGF